MTTPETEPPDYGLHPVYLHEADIAAEWKDFNAWLEGAGYAIDTVDGWVVWLARADRAKMIAASSMRRLTALWRYSVTVLPPSAPDFYVWLAMLDTAIDERARRAP